MNVGDAIGTVARLPATPPAGHGRRLAAALILASLTVSVMSTLGAPLIPTVARSQHVSLETAQWMLTITLLVGAVSTPVLGRLGDGAGRTWVLLGTLGTVFIGSVVAATAYSFPQLIIGRGLQGIGYATVPLSITLAREHITGGMQPRAIAALSISASTGAGLGYPLTTLVAQHFTYHAAFWLAAVVSVISMAVVVRVVPRGPLRHGHVKLDIPGALLLGGGLGATLVAVSRAETWGWGSTKVLGIGSAGLVTLVAWAVVQLHTEHPLMDLRLSAQRAVMGANLAGLFMGMGMFAGVSLMNRLLQTPPSAGYGISASLTVVGLMLLPVSAGSLLSQPLARAVAARTNSRTVLVGGSLLMVAASAVYAFNHAHLWEAGGYTFVIGIAVGTTFAVMPTLIVSQVPQERTGSALGLNQVLRSSGGAVGSAVSITVLTAFMTGGSAVPAEHGYVAAFLAAGGMCLAATLAGIGLVPATKPGPATRTAPRTASSRA